MYPRLIALLLTLTLGACAGTPDDELDSLEADKTAAALYLEAKAALDAGDYETAIERLESLEGRFPFGRYAQQAQLDIAYAYYKYEEPESAVAAADRFIKLYPRHGRVDYAYYLRGVIKFSQVQGYFDNVANLDPAQRDPEAARQAFHYFSELVNRFPDSPYTEDAMERMVYLRNSLARSEIHAAEFYMKRGAYVAVANRARYVVERFSTTPSVEPALRLMIQAYEKLGLDDLAADARRVLAHNFSDTNEKNDQQNN